LNHRLHHRPRGLQQMVPHLLEKVSTLLSGQRLDQLLLGSGQDALKAHYEQIADQVGVNIFGPPAHVFLLEASHPVADGGLNFALGFHADIEWLTWRPRETKSIA